MKKTLKHFLFSLFCLGFINNTAFAQLAVGDIAIVGVNTDGPSSSTDEFSIVTLASIPSGTTIYFSDYYWDNTNVRWGNDGLNATTPNLTEGIIKWTTTSTIAAYTVFRISWTMGSGTPSVSGLPGTVTLFGQTGTTTSGPFGTGGDNIFIYQSNNNGVTPSNWIFGWCNGLATTVSANNAWQSNNTTISGVHSMLPSALTNGTSAISFAQVGSGSASNPSYDNNVYNIGSLRGGTKAQLLAAICTTSNWAGDENTAYDISPTSIYFTGANAFSSTPLPIELISFDAKSTEGGNFLTWVTASESQNKGFNIERSADGSRFEKIAFVKGAGTTSKRQDYRFIDIVPKNQSGATLYYRLKQLDEDGRFEYSKIITIAQNSKNELSVFPNPSNGTFTVIGLEKIENEQLIITNSIGQILPIQLTSNNQLDFSAYSSGMYYLRVGRSGQVIKMIKAAN